MGLPHAIRTVGGQRGRRVLLILFGLATLILLAVAAIRSSSDLGTRAPAPSTGTPSASPPTTVSANKKTGSAAATKPAWAELSAAQQTALAPLAPEWDSMPSARKTKWLAIGKKYATMSPAEQQRVQKRMSEWMKLTPQQRLVARDSYTRAKKLDQDQKSARWEQYQQLPPEQKEKLANTTIKKRVTTLPPAHGANKAAVAPMEPTPQPVLEQALTPQLGGHPDGVSTIPIPAPPPAATSPATSAQATPATPPAPVPPPEQPAPLPEPPMPDPIQH